ncbi:hypothetical protein [Saccharothrix luteola]|uniref:hypothetical protein n=1 Tax=Saccharothrix luteola TaxID=2893018 RepID=UPI001E611A8C|nr:hypothetical protein [Saccharothrix luteola]MCC8243073.1 hypothetical protein [Saccharothrix luteola]
MTLVVDDQTVDLIKLAAFAQPVGDVSIDGAVLTLQSGGERCYAVKVSDPEADGIFDDWPEAHVPKSPSAIFSVDYRTPDLVVALVHSIAQWRSLTVDTNYGQVVSGGDLVPDMLRPT